MSAEDFARSRVGQTLKERYRLDGLLGIGGMAAVYRGAHRNGNRVAIKVLHPELSTNEDIRSRFLKEGYTANAVDHPGAVRVLDDDVEPDGTVFIVMELLEGETVDARWNRCGNRMSTKDVLRLGYDLLDVLAAAHERGIVHRDIKPENLFFTREGTVKILDFGIARMRDGSAGSATLTANGRMMGSPAFMPREQALGLTKEIDGRTDIWALGATMFTLLSGRFVHEAETVEGMIVATATQAPKPLSSVAPDVPALAAAIVDRSLGFERDARFPDARAMRHAIEEAHASLFGGRLGAAVAAVPALSAARIAATLDATMMPTGAFAPGLTVMASTAAPDGTVPPRADRTVPATIVPHAPQMPPGISTTAGVSHESPQRLLAAAHERREPRRRGASPTLIVGVVLAALGIGGTGAGLVLSKGAERPASASVRASASSPDPDDGIQPPALNLSPLEPAPAASPLPVPVSVSGGSPRTPTLAASAPVGPKPPVTRTTPPQAPAQAALPPAAPPPVAQPPAPNCDPWWYLDDKGNRHRKPQCQ